MSECRAVEVYICCPYDQTRASCDRSPDIYAQGSAEYRGEMTLKGAADSTADHGNPPETGLVEDMKAQSSEKNWTEVDHIHDDLVYDDIDHEPELHFRTWIALASMWLYNYVIVFALFSPPAVVCGELERKWRFQRSLTSVTIDLIYRIESGCHRCADVGLGLTHAATGRFGTSPLVDFGHLPNPQDPHDRAGCAFFHWRRHSTGFEDHIQPHRCANHDLLWIFGRASWLRNSK